MSWWIPAAVIIAAVLILIDWLIVMGADPRRWKGDKDGKR